MGRCSSFGCKEIGVYKFPKDTIMRRKWEKSLRIVKFKCTDHSRLCGKHFKHSDFETTSKTTGFPLRRKFLKKSAVPSVFRCTSNSISPRMLRLEKRNAKRDLKPASTDTSEIFEDKENQLPLYDIHYLDLQQEIASEVTFHPEEDNPDEENLISQSTQTPTLFRLFSNDELLMNKKYVLYYTGLESYEKFRLVLSTLYPMALHLKYKGSQVMNIDIEDQFLILLIKLNKCDFELSQIFGVSETAISNIFITWLNFVYDLWSLIDIWPMRQIVDYYMPQQFKKFHDKTRVIIDCTEIPIAKPKNPLSQQATFSSYKSKNTIKFLIGATPGGLISYCSDGYGGSTSDRQMIERSDLLSKCDSGDSIMADRGFNVQDLFATKNIGINIPTFLKGKSQLSGVQVKHDRNLAKYRVHIERLIGLSKTFKILTSELNAYYVPLASRIFLYVLCYVTFVKEL
ncbi:uncharacterized protein [Leptinotarsa decemlineata]|uniref:uncharacterized protein n=1 Tax=Leptinotarsa decemlineata TaxID=7539 RepID=UPI003D306EF4